MMLSKVPSVGIQYFALMCVGVSTFAATYWLTISRSSVEMTTSVSSLHSVTEPSQSPSTPSHEGMVWIPGGEFSMGSNLKTARPEERPAHRVSVDGFWMDEKEVTNSQFMTFVESTGYVTTAERAPTVEELLANLPEGTPSPSPELLVAGSLVFTPPSHSVQLTDVRRWWTWTPGASWRHPDGPESDLAGRSEHPVVHVSWDDAVAYSNWSGKRLPTEAEWEFAARGGLEGQPYVWGSDPPSETHPQANLWTGSFPHQNLAIDGFERTAPVGSYQPNGYGLYDMAGNVWEWCSDWYDRDLYQSRSATTVTVNPQGPAGPKTSIRSPMSQRSQRGGSFLCSDNYCSRYRPSARHGCTPDTGMSHIGFRCVVSSSDQQKQ